MNNQYYFLDGNRQDIQLIQFDRSNLPNEALFQEYRKIYTTKAVRVTGPFTVVTREGVITCQDGYLAVDSGGWPYPIAADEFDRIYVKA